MINLKFLIQFNKINKMLKDTNTFTLQCVTYQ